MVPPVVKLAWEPVSAAQGDKVDWGTCLLPSLRFFLRSADEVSRTYVPEQHDL